MKKHTDETAVKQAAENYLESQHKREFDIIRSAWRCHEGNDCPDIHDVYAVATDESEIQVVVTLDFRKEPPKVTRDSYLREIASLEATRELEKIISSPAYLLKAYAQSPDSGLPQKPLMVKLYVKESQETAEEEVIEAMKKIISYASQGKYELLDIEVGFFSGLPSHVQKKDFNLGSFNEEKTAYEKEYRIKTWQFETGGQELANPEAILQNPHNNITVME